MNELLFSCKSEKKALENILAYNQIKKCDEVIAKYNREIADLKKEINAILKSQDINENYIDIISGYKSQLKGMENEASRMKELDATIKTNDDKIKGFNLKIKEMESELESLKRVIFDSDDAKVIVDTQNQIEVLNKRIEDLYDLVENINTDNTTALLEIEFLKTSKLEDSFEATDVAKVEISNELHRISAEFTDVIKDLELSVREDIEFCTKKITNREKEIAKFEDRKSNIVAEFSDALDLDYISEMEKLSTLFSELELYKYDEAEKVEEVAITEDFEPIYEDSNEVNIFDQPEVNEEELDEDSTTEDVNIETDMVKIESIEKPDLEFKEISEASKLMEDEEEVEKEEIKNEIEVDNSNSFSTIGSVPYIFSEGESLESIAEKVYPSKECWQAIYYYNKEEIDSYLTANGMSNDFETVETLASDKYLFAGIQLNIPTDANYRG